MAIISKFDSSQIIQYNILIGRDEYNIKNNYRQQDHKTIYRILKHLTYSKFLNTKLNLFKRK